MGRFIYRVIREDEDISQGIKVVHRTPASNEEERLKRLRHHIQNGSKDWYKDRYFISMTEQFDVTYKYRQGASSQRSRVVLIDQDSIPQSLIRMSNLEETFAKGDVALLKKVNNYTQADSEILTDEDIAPEHCKEVSPLMFDMLDAISSSIVKNDPTSDRERQMLDFVQTVYFDSPEFEQVLQDTSELDVYEHYFFENYYQNGKTFDEILKEMNQAIALNGGKAIDLSVLESLKVSTVKKLLNSDKTLEYLKKYNEEQYKSEEISSQLEGAIAEKKEEKKSQETKDSIRSKCRNLKLRIEKLELEISELRKELADCIRQHSELYEKYEAQNKNRTSSGFRETLEAGVNPEELSVLIDKKVEIEKQIRIKSKRKDIYEKMLHELSSSRGIEKKENSRKIAAKYQGVTLRRYDFGWHYKRPNDMQARTTATKFKEMEQSNGCIAIGETAYIDVKREEGWELMYTDGATSAMGIDRRGTVLTIFSSPSWSRKAIGCEKNNERIGKKKTMTVRETSFGLDEMVLIKEGKSRELRKKISDEIARYDTARKKAAEEVTEDFKKRVQSQIIS